MLNFTGIGSAFNLEEGSNSAFFVINDTLYLIDCGETTFKAMVDCVDFSEYDEVNVLLTHVHNDHIGSLGTMISYLYILKGIKVNVIHPQRVIVEILDRMGIAASMYHFFQTMNFEREQIAIRFVKTSHVSEMMCYGIEILSDKYNLYYSGDSNELLETILSKLENKTYDYVYQDVSINRSGSHLYYKDFIDLVPKHLHSRIYCMHLDLDATEELNRHGLSTVAIYKK